MTIICDFDEHALSNYKLLRGDTNARTFNIDSAYGYFGKGGQIPVSGWSCVVFPDHAFNLPNTSRRVISLLVRHTLYKNTTAGNFGIGGVGFVDSTIADGNTGMASGSASYGFLSYFDSRNQSSTTAAAYGIRYPNIATTSLRANANATSVDFSTVKFYRVEGILTYDASTGYTFTVNYYDHATNSLLQTLTYSVASISSITSMAPALVIYGNVHFDCAQYQVGDDPYVSNLRSKRTTDGGATWSRVKISAPALASPRGLPKVWDPTNSFWKW